MCPFASPYSFTPFCRHVVTAAIMLSAPWALHLELVCRGCMRTLLLLWCLPPASCLSPEWPGLPAHHPTMPTFTRALTLPCLQERTGRPCLNRMHLVCLPAQGQGQLATWLLCQTGLTYGSACHCYNKRSAVALCVQEKGHILSEYLQYVPLDSVRSWIEMDGKAATNTFTRPVSGMFLHSRFHFPVFTEAKLFPFSFIW